MCGIIGLFKNRGNQNWDVDCIFDTVMHWRRKGVDGIGFLAVKSEGCFTRSCFLSPSDFLIKHGGAFKEILTSPSTKAVFMHNRWRSTGLPGEKGVQPFVGKRYIVMHNGHLSPTNRLPVNETWKYVAGSDSEYICAYLNRESVLNMNPIENITKSLHEIYDVYNQIGVVLIFDTWESKLYLFRDNARTLVYDLASTNALGNFWNNRDLALRFSEKVFDVEHGGLLCIDPLTGKIDQVLNLLENNGNQQYVPTRDLLRGPGIGGLLNVHAHYGNAASSKKNCNGQRIQVYGASKWLREEKNAPMVIAIPRVLREKVGVQVGDMVLVRNRNLGRTAELTVCRTDKRLLSAIPFLNNNPEAHACLPPIVREILVLTQVDYRSRSFCFKKVFSTIDIYKKNISAP